MTDAAKDDAILRIAMSLSRNEWARLYWYPAYLTISSSLIEKGLLIHTDGFHQRTAIGDRVAQWAPLFFDSVLQ